MSEKHPLRSLCLLICLAIPVAAQSPGSAPASSAAAAGGGQNADFDSLIDLIVSTVATESWAENGGGEAEIRPFPNGVYVDAEGVLQQASATSAAVSSSKLLRPLEPPAANRNVRTTSKLRCVSLTRLEAEIVRRRAAGEPLAEEMLTLAGLHRAQYVFVLPTSDNRPGEVVLAGPAGPWRLDDAGRLVGDSGDAIVRLDDLLTLWRFELAHPGKSFGCSITPRQDALASAQTYLARTAQQPLPPGRTGREEWLTGLRRSLGRQEIEVWGLPPTCRVARVLVEADHHMKLIGMGLAAGVPGVESYLNTVTLDAQGNPPPLSVLRWWFALNYDEVRASVNRTQFELHGPGAQVLSENELLTHRGERIHTGAADELTSRFARNFTTAFSELSRKYPVYSELRNVFDLALIVSLLRREGLAEKAAWTPALFTSAEHLPLPRYAPAKSVPTVVNHRTIRDRRVRHIVAGVSGGVLVESTKLLETTATKLAKPLASQPPCHQTWWWDPE